MWVVWRILKSTDLSNEVLKEAFLQIWNSAASYYRSHLAKPLPWMASITRYRALDQLDNERCNSNHTYTLDDEEDLSRSDEPGHTLGTSHLRFSLAPVPRGGSNSLFFFPKA